LTNWWVLRIIGMKGVKLFEDTYTVITASHCYKLIGFNVYNKNQVNPDCFYPYGHKLLDLVNLLNLNNENLTLYGFTQIALIFVCLGSMLVKYGPALRNNILQMLVIVSPPTWLLYERANIDGAVFFILVLSGVLFNSKYRVFSFILVSISVLMKFYTFPILFLFLWKENLRILRILYSFSTVFILISIALDIKRRELVQPGSLSFGVPIFQFWLNTISKNIFYSHVIFSPLIGAIFGYMFLISCIFSSKLFFLKHWSRHISYISERKFSVVFLLCALTFISCFIAGTNYDYRLIFLIGCSIILIGVLDLKEPSGIILALLLLLSSWLTIFPFGLTGKEFLLLQWVGNLIQFEVCAILILACINILRESSLFQNN
jgi:hypothetical protein